MSQFTPQEDNNHQPVASNEVDQLKAQVAALEQLLEVYERETIEKSNKLEQTLADLNLHTQRLTHAESTLSALRSMLNSMGSPVIVVDPQGNFLFLNSFAESFLGIHATCPSLQCWAKNWDIYCKDQTTRYSLESFPLLRAMQGEELDATEMFVRLPESLEGYWFSVTARPFCNHDCATQGGIAMLSGTTQSSFYEYYSECDRCIGNR